MSQFITGSIREKLSEGWAQERRFFHLRGASRFAIWLIALTALAFLIDWGLFSRTGMPSAFGVLLLVVILAVLGWVLWFEWLRHLKPFDPVRVALDVEKQHPDLSSMLVSYVQLEGPAKDQPNVSAELVEAMREQAVSMARPLDFRDIIDFRQLKNLLIVASCVVLLFGVLSISWGDYFTTLMQRLVGVSAEYPKNTEVYGVTESLVVRIGDSAVIEAKASGVIPEAGRLFTRPAGDSEANWKELPLKKDSGGNAHYSRELKDLTVDLLYYVRLGDDRSGEYRIDVITPPQIVGIEVMQKFQDYMKKDPKPSDQLNLEVPEGTEITWKLTSDVELEEFRVETDLPEEVLAEAAAEAKAAGERAQFAVEIGGAGKQPDFFATADQSFKYTFRWVERESGNLFEFDDVQYSVRVVADTPPDVSLVQPQANGPATLNKVLKIKAVASDDHGLAKAWLVYSLDGSEEKEERVLIRDFSKNPDPKIEYDWELQKSVEGLKVDSQVTFAIEVSDHYPDEIDHLRRSTTRKLTIVTPKDYLEWHRLKLAAQIEEMLRLQEAEKLSSTKVGEIKTQEDPSKSE